MEAKNETTPLLFKDWLKETLINYPLWVVGIGLCAGMVLLTVHLVNLTWDLVTSNALKNASLYSEALTEFRTLYTSEVVSRVQPHGVDIAHDYKERPGAIPLPATLSIILGESIAEHGSGGGVKLYSDYPFPWRKQTRAPLDQFEQNALTFLRENPLSPYYRFDEIQGASVLRYATADRMRPQCVACHNQHPDTPRKGWKTGDVRGVLSITLPIDQLFLKTQEQLWKTFFLMIMVLLITLIGIGFALRSARSRILSEEASRIKTQFLINVSHELRTPLNGVLGMAELLRQTMLDARQLNYVKLLLNSGQHLLTVINDLLELSKLEAERVKLESIDFFMGDVIEEVLALLTSAAAEKELEMGYELGDDLLTSFRGDPGRLRQILTNLLSNAVKFTEKGQVVIRVGLDDLVENIYHLRFEIQDTGIGIEKQKEEKLFLPFSQADDSHTRRFGGTGLGLKISKDLVELMNGSIGVQSTEGQGCTFWFTVPLPVGNQKQTNTLDTAPLKGRRLLIVDTNNISCEMVSKHALNWGMSIKIAQNAEEAFNALKASLNDEPFALANINMDPAELASLDLIYRIRSDPHFRTLPLSLTFFMKNPAPFSDIQLLGPSALTTKPIRKNDLLQNYLKLITKTAAPLPKTSEAKIETQNATGIKVLIVEDNIINQEVIVAMVSRLGHSYDVAQNGITALQAYQEKEYQLIFMDCQMPDMDGYQTTKKIRQKENEERHTPIIAISAHVTLEAKRLAEEAGMDDFMTKPISLDDLRRVFEKWT